MSRRDSICPRHLVVPTVEPVRRRWLRQTLATLATGAVGSLLSAHAAPPVPGRFVPEMSDEFAGEALDTTIWRTYNPHWTGDEDEAVDPDAVSVRGGIARLTVRLLRPRFYATALLESLHLQQYGYFEIRSRAALSKVNQAFWFYAWTPTGTREIDVFEMAPASPGERHSLQTNLHVYDGDPALENDHNRRSYPMTWEDPSFDPCDWHVYGLLWTPQVLRWYVDGRTIREARNHHFHLPMRLLLGAGIYLKWRGEPGNDELSHAFEVDYVRTWALVP